MNGINNLKDKFAIKVVFCLLDAETCIQRVLDRTQGNQKRVISPLDLAAKFQRVFPDNHIKLALEFDLPYIEMDMSLSLDQRLEIIKRLIND